MKKMSLSQKVSVGFAVMFLMLAVIGLISYQNTIRLEDDEGLVSHSYQVLEQLKSLPAELKDTQRGTRGYVITGETQYLEPYYNSVEKVHREVNALGILTADTPAQQRQVEALRPVVDKAMSALKEVVEARESRGFEAATELVQRGQANNLVNEVQRIARQMEDEEYRLLKQHSAQASASAWRTKMVIASGSAIAFIFVILAAWLINRNIAAQRRRDKKMHEMNFALTHALEAIAQCDEQRRYVSVNKAYAEILGYQPEEMIGLEWPQTGHPEEREILLTAYVQMRRFGRAETEARGIRLDG